MRTAGIGSFFAVGGGGLRIGFGAQLRQIQASVLGDHGIHERCIDIDVDEGIGAMPDRRQFEVDEETPKAHQLLAARIAERQILDLELEQEGVDLDFAHRGLHGDGLGDVL